MEYWSNDERIGVFFFNTPILHHFKTETFKNFWQLLNHLFIGYNFVYSSFNRIRQKRIEIQEKERVHELSRSNFAAA